jgi:hypothetical protein
MKNLINSALYSNKKSFSAQLLNGAKNYAALLFSLLLLIGVFTGCEKQDMKPVDELQNNELHSSQAKNAEGNVVNNYTGLSKQTTWELKQARAATARYRDIKNAIKDGYSNIMVDVENMGHHYMNTSLVDGTFELTKPEILVYNRNEDGSQELVAVEYAVPIELTPNLAPEGFSGNGDVWDRNTGFGLWLQHAWVWSYNPSGVFNPTNPLIHLH